MQSLKPSELKLLHRLAIEPSTYQAELAKELGISRSAVNQVWTRLERERRLCVCSNIDYGQLGYAQIFGWAKSDQTPDILDKFKGWLHSSSYTTNIVESSMSSSMDKRLLFEAIVPHNRINAFQEQLARFKKRPYNLALVHDQAVRKANHMNLAQFNGSHWNIQSGFRFEASIGAAKSYLDVLPTNRTLQLSNPNGVYPEEASIAAVIEKNYSVSSKQLGEWLVANGFDCPSGRTLRRKLVDLRKTLALPYLSVDEIGLTQNVVVCVEEESKQSVSRLLHAQSSTFPRAKIVVGSKLTTLELRLPSTFDWLAMSSSLSALGQTAVSISTFLTRSEITRKGLENVLISEKGRKV
ncbi:MAG: helix-turn-helix domain-containing protein [Candidatus Thorarchaeota archaeon]